MPELSDLLHRSVDDVDVPRPHVHDITAQGRALRTRRRLGAAVAAAVVLGAVGGGFALADSFGGDRRSEIANPTTDTPTPYDEWSAWSLDDDVTIGGRPVRLPGQTVNLAQTSAGVVAKTFPGDDDPARYVLVRPDGSTRALALPASVPTVDGDIAAPRIAWVTSGRDVLVLHVWDVEKDEELARVDVPSPGTTPPSAGEILEPALLDGEAAYFQTHGGVSRRVLWATGEVRTLPRPVASVRSGVATGGDSSGSTYVVMDAATGRVRRAVQGDVIRLTVSPDGRWLYGSTSDGSFVEPVDGGKRVPLADLSVMASWSPGGAVVGQKGTEATMMRCTTDGRCTEKVVGEGGEVSVLSADFLNAG
ncbi:hypothetical protein [Nocardioides sp. LML1-1-1.1]|uniref:hypothetical protein n=1 Tax=Nocardioides sp. LML1-1-1.1 TaxID=3135248 RepID=UPI0034160334